MPKDADTSGLQAISFNTIRHYKQIVESQLYGKTEFPV